MHESQFTGAIVGLAVGDALGYPAEFRSRDQILREIGPAGISDFIRLRDERFSRPFIIGTDHPPGTYTDDTQMSLAVAEGLLAAKADDLDLLMRAVSRQFIRWAESPDNNRSPGETCMTGCRNLRRGVPWREAGVANSKGCGSAMRVAPIGLMFSDLERVAEVARASSLLTHGHPAALEGAAAAALMVALVLQDTPPDQLHTELMRRCGERNPDFDQCLAKVPGLLHQPPEEVLTEEILGESWVAEEAVASALYCVWRHPNDFSAAVLTAVNTDGDSDSIAAITGSVMGARLGLEGIPETWVAQVEQTELLQDTGQRLWRHRR